MLKLASLHVPYPGKRGWLPQWVQVDPVLLAWRTLYRVPYPAYPPFAYEVREVHNRIREHAPALRFKPEPALRVRA